MCLTLLRLIHIAFIAWNSCYCPHYHSLCYNQFGLCLFLLCSYFCLSFTYCLLVCLMLKLQKRDTVSSEHCSPFSCDTPSHLHQASSLYFSVFACFITLESRPLPRSPVSLVTHLLLCISAIHYY